MFLKNYSLLPDYMDSQDIALKIEEIPEVSANSDISTVDIGQALLEIIHRQRENHREKLPENLVLQIKQWIVSFWDTSPWDFFKVKSVIIVNLDLSLSRRLSTPRISFKCF